MSGRERLVLAPVFTGDRRRHARWVGVGQVIWAVFAIAVCAGCFLGYYMPRVSLVYADLRIPDRPLLYSAGTGIFAGATVLAVGSSAVVWAWIAVALIGSVLGVIDIAHHRLPDRLVLALYGSVVVLLVIPAVTGGDWGAYVRALLAGAAMFGAYLVLALIYPAGMGLGDVKLAGALGLALGFLGWAYVVVGVFIAFVLPLLLVRWRNRKDAIPFGPFMIVGAVAAVPVTGWLLSSPTL